MGSGSYEYKPDVDMSGYVSLDNRVKGACRCEKCSSNPVVQVWYKNDLICSSGGLCYDDGNCFSKRRVYVGSVKGKSRYRFMVVKCSRCVDGLK